MGPCSDVGPHRIKHWSCSSFYLNADLSSFVLSYFLLSSNVRNLVLSSSGILAAALIILPIWKILRDSMIDPSVASWKKRFQCLASLVNDPGSYICPHNM